MEISEKIIIINEYLRNIIEDYPQLHRFFEVFPEFSSMEKQIYDESRMDIVQSSGSADEYALLFSEVRAASAEGMTIAFDADALHKLSIHALEYKVQKQGELAAQFKLEATESDAKALRASTELAAQFKLEATESDAKALRASTSLILSGEGFSRSHQATPSSSKMYCYQINSYLSYLGCRLVDYNEPYRDTSDVYNESREYALIQAIIPEFADKIVPFITPYESPFIEVDDLDGGGVRYMMKIKDRSTLPITTQQLDALAPIASDLLLKIFDFRRQECEQSRAQYQAIARSLSQSASEFLAQSELAAAQLKALHASTTVDCTRTYTDQEAAGLKQMLGLEDAVVRRYQKKPGLTYLKVDAAQRNTTYDALIGRFGLESCRKAGREDLIEIKGDVLALFTHKPFVNSPSRP